LLGLGFGFAPSEVRAGFSLIGLNFDLTVNVNVPVNINASSNPTSPVDVIYQETDLDFELTVRTNSSFNPEKDYKFDIRNDTFWSLNLTFNYYNGLLEDESVFELTGTVFHNVQPRGPDHLTDRPQGSQKQISFPSFNLETEATNPGWNQNAITFSKPSPPVNHPASHLDSYFENQLVITRSAADTDELSSFTYTLKGRHLIPEPSGLALACAALASIGLTRVGRRRRG
jgi:hypothetical protein